MSLQPGTTLGPYSVTAKIGEGGMGEVYRARDTKLDRDVALKVLPEAFTEDPDRLARFEREAKVLASLNHPNIGGIHGLEESDGVRALVLEYIDGPTLADRIAQGPIPVDEALPIAKQIAEALEAAHEAGVIHRDLKPANIKVREDGTVKVLDFGLAKAMQPEASDASQSMSPTISLTAAATQMGMVIGTAAYMAPEQASGKVVDKRADVWAFGVVLYEMLTGTRPFVGDDVSKTLAHVIAIDLDWSTLPKGLPPVLTNFLRGCLEKEPRKRIRDIGDVRLALEGAFEDAAAVPSEDVLAPKARAWQRPGWLIGTTVLVALITGFTVWTLRSPAPGRVVQSWLTPPGEGLPLLFPPVDIAISPDGLYAVYRGADALTVRPVDQLSGTPLPGTEQAYSPFVSPDSASVGFWDVSTGLNRIPILGGAVERVAATDALFGASWGADDTIVFGTVQPSGLWRVSADGGEPELLTSPESALVNHVWPTLLPGGRAVLFTIVSGSSIDSAQIAVLDLDSGEQTVVLEGGTSPRYVPTGHLVYAVNGTLRAAAFSLDRLAVAGNAVQILEGVVTKTSGAADFSVAGDGSLLYVPGTGQQQNDFQLVWVDHQGDVEVVPVPPGAYGSPRVSPDGAQAVVEIAGQNDADIWIADLVTGTTTRLTFSPEDDRSPIWTPDGEQIVFVSGRDGGGLFRKAADGTGQAERLGAQVAPSSWSSNGQTLVVMSATAETSTDIGALSLEDGTLRMLLDGEPNEAYPEVSPDGRYIAYHSDETGQDEVYVRPFPNLNDGKWQVSDFGFSPVWAPNGSALFYRYRSAQMITVPVSTQPVFSHGTPRVLLDAAEFELARAGIARPFDLAPDGERFLMLREVGLSGDESAGLVLIQDWFEELTRLVPTDQ